MTGERAVPTMRAEDWVITAICGVTLLGGVAFVAHIHHCLLSLSCTGQEEMIVYTRLIGAFLLTASVSMFLHLRYFGGLPWWSGVDE